MKYFKTQMTSILTLVMLLSSQGFATGILHNKAPSLTGKSAFGGGLLSIRKLQKDFSFKVDAKGKRLVDKDGDFIPKITKNVIVLNFFSTTCIPCIREIPTYNLIADKFEGKPVHLIYVNVDAILSQEKLLTFVKKRNINLPMMLPNQREAVRKYNVETLPRMIFIDRSGIIQHILVGYQDDLEQEMTKVINGLL